MTHFWRLASDHPIAERSRITWEKFLWPIMMVWLWRPCRFISFQNTVQPEKKGRFTTVMLQHYLIMARAFFEHLGTDTVCHLRQPAFLILLVFYLRRSRKHRASAFF
jgi:hypothetical protein